MQSEYFLTNNANEIQTYYYNDEIKSISLSFSKLLNFNDIPININILSSSINIYIDTATNILHDQVNLIDLYFHNFINEIQSSSMNSCNLNLKLSKPKVNGYYQFYYSLNPLHLLSSLCSYANATLIDTLYISATFNNEIDIYTISNAITNLNDISIYIGVTFTNIDDNYDETVVLYSWDHHINNTNCQYNSVNKPALIEQESSEQQIENNTTSITIWILAISEFIALIILFIIYYQIKFKKKQKFYSYQMEDLLRV